MWTECYSSIHCHSISKLKTIIKLRIIGNELLALLTAQHLVDQQCQQRKIGLVQGLLVITIIYVKNGYL